MNESSFMLIAPTRRKVHEMRVIYLMERGSNLVWDHVQEEKPSKSGMVRVDITYWMVHGTKEEIVWASKRHFSIMSFILLKFGFMHWS